MTFSRRRHLLVRSEVSGSYRVLCSQRFFSAVKLRRPPDTAEELLASPHACQKCLDGLAQQTEELLRVKKLFNYKELEERLLSGKTIVRVQMPPRPSFVEMRWAGRVLSQGCPVGGGWLPKDPTGRP